MTYITDGLTDGGVTKAGNYAIDYDSALADGKVRVDELVKNADADFDIMQTWFEGVAFPFQRPITVHVTSDATDQNGCGASWPGSWPTASPVKLTPYQGSHAGVLRMLLVAEVTEMFMLAQARMASSKPDSFNVGWFPNKDKSEGSQGEALSVFLAHQLLLKTGVGLLEVPGYAWIANDWVQSPDQPNWVNSFRSPKNLTAEDTNTNAARKAIGCSILFIYYLYHQLQFSIEEIIAAVAYPTGVNTLAGIYRNLTLDMGDPFPFFQRLLQHYPGSAGITIATGPDINNNDPFPVGLVSLWVQKNTFSRDDVQGAINDPQKKGTFESAFYVVVEGFSKDSFGVLNLQVVPDAASSLMTTDGITLSKKKPFYEDESKPKAPQRIWFPYDITFTEKALKAFPSQGSKKAVNELDLHVELQISGTKVPASDAYAAFELIAGANPYFTDINPEDHNVFYLSQDLRVFTATPDPNKPPASGWPKFETPDGFTYIQALLAYLNNDSHGFTTGANDPFANFPDQFGAFTGDSSVTPYTLTTPQHANFNFAVARVRLTGPTNAQVNANVSVFFRLWVSESPDTDYQPDTTYASEMDPAGLPQSPEVGRDPTGGIITIPFFATAGGIDSNSDYSGTAVNKIPIKKDKGSGTVFHYFGCFLNLYDTNNIIDGKQVQKHLPGTHHCLVAQIACDTAPILFPSTVPLSPANCDKLAQRNLQITPSNNPGGPETHRIPQTFDVRPSPLTSGGSSVSVLDELMIEWGNTPVGSVAKIYWPQVKASDIVKLADALYSFHALEVADAHTIQCVVTGGVTCIPIPAGAGENYAGLLTIDLPQTIVKGQEFDVVVRRVVPTQIIEQPVPVVKSGGVSAPPEGSTGKAPPVRVPPPRIWRNVAGSFQVKIPVSTAETMLPFEMNTLAMLKGRLQAMAPTNRWYPVLVRYIGYIAARVGGLGGDPDKVPASLEGAPVTMLAPKHETAEFMGKVVQVAFDCHGDFTGFVLDDCCDTQSFETRDQGLGELVIRAFRDRFRLSVTICLPAKHIRSVAIVE